MLVDLLLYAVLCAAPALVLLPVWGLDLEPDNEIRHHQDDRRISR